MHFPGDLLKSLLYVLIATIAAVFTTNITPFWTVVSVFEALCKCTVNGAHIFQIFSNLALILNKNIEIIS